jgi:menaquinol-cytochrome c reductase iron-sulfur subunit
MEKHSRRTLLIRLGWAINGAAATLLLAPVLRYLLGSTHKQGAPGDRAWVTLGAVSSFPEGQTRMATYRNPITEPWDGATADIPCWVRRIRGEQFQVFAVNCAHLGCPVRWFPQSALFLCPCHGGAYYEDGSLAAGPPPRGLFEYQHRIENGSLAIFAGRLPTLHESASLGGRGPSCA